jgi:predicted GIY-YIG superfamily endonuclease
MKKNNTNYSCGISKEKSVAKKYKRNGALSVTQMPGSRGAYDLEISHSSRKNHLVQVKSTCSAEGQVKKLSDKEKERLIREADKRNAIAVIALVQANGRSDLRYAKTNRKVNL